MSINNLQPAPTADRESIIQIITAVSSYFSSIHVPELDNPLSESDLEMIREYERQIKKTEGFYAPKLPRGTSIFGDSITEVTPDNQKVIAAAAFAVKAHNIKEQAGRVFSCGRHADIELERVVRANSVWLQGTVYFLTLQASDKAFYEAKVRMCPVANSPDFIPELQMFRRAKHYKE